METPVGGDDGVLLLNREGEGETVVGRMIKVDRQTRSGGSELAHRMRYGDRRRFQRIRGLRKILLRLCRRGGTEPIGRWRP